MANRRLSVARFPATPLEPAININVIDNGDGTVSLYVDDGLAQYSAPITATGAPVVAAGGTGSVTGSGTTNFLPKWTNGAASVLGNSRISDNGSLINLASRNTSIGDTATIPVGNGTKITLVDSTKIITLRAGVPAIELDGSTEELNVLAAGGINFNSIGLVRLGDTGGNLNGTKIVIDDSAETILLDADNGVLVSDLTANAFIFSGTASRLTSTAAPTDGQLLIGDTGGPPVLAALTAGANVTITNGAGSITIAAAGGSPGGADTQVQFNDGGVLAGDAGLTFDNTSKILSVTGGVTIAANIAPITFVSVLGFSIFVNDATDAGVLNVFANGAVQVKLAVSGVLLPPGNVFSWGAVSTSRDSSICRLSAGLLAIGSGLDGSFAGSLKLTDIFTNDATFVIRTTTTLTNGAGASIGTLLNAPAAGNPTKWIGIDDNGTTRFIPAW